MYFLREKVFLPANIGKKFATKLKNNYLFAALCNYCLFFYSFCREVVVAAFEVFVMALNPKRNFFSSKNKICFYI